MQIYAMKTNHFREPLGFELLPLTFSWKVKGIGGDKVTVYRVEAARDEAFTDILFDSGFKSAISGVAYTPEGLELRPRTRYWWRVYASVDGAEHVSDVSWFETGKMDEAWAASWIVPPCGKMESDEESIEPHPYFCVAAKLKEGIKSARMYACGMGVYELYANGARVGDEYLTPGFHSYDYWLQVQVYDITDNLRSGANIVGAMLGNGWAKGRFGLGETTENFCAQFGFIAELHIEYENGEHEVVVTDGNWLYAPSPVLDSSIYNGETYDATKEIPDWSCVDADGAKRGNPKDKLWKPALVCGDFQEKWGLGPLSDRLSPPVKIMVELKPTLIRTPAGEDVLDMGQNMVGLLKFINSTPRGRKLSLYFGELLQDGNFYRDNLRSAKAEYHYISSGEITEVRQFFTFYGYRYVKLVGFKKPKAEDFTGLVLHSDMELTGSIETSNDNVNRLFQNVIWGQRGNFLDVPTDCPQRDERLGWTGDAQVFCETAAWNMDVYAFFGKYLRDMAYAQKNRGGSVPHVVPDIYKRGEENSKGGSACGWADAATVIPWTMYEMYGDKSILENAFPVMQAWVDWVYSEDESTGGRRLWTTGFHFGDWLAMDAPIPGGTFGATDVGFLASAYYFRSAGLTAKAAEILGDNDKAEYYSKLAREIKAAIQKEYFTPTNRISVKTQTAMAVALDFGFCPDGGRERIAESLKVQLVFDGMKIKTGFLGTPALTKALSDNGAHSYALRLFFNEEMPSWLYPVKMGATTIWERWDSVLPDGKISDTGMNSLNHYAYGCIASWMYRYICGVNPLAPGFSRVRFAPRPCGNLEFARASFDSPYGDVVCGWKRLADGKIELEIAVPYGAEGELVLTDCGIDKILEQFPYAVECDGSVTAKLKPGKYTFTYKPFETRYFDVGDKVYELMADEKAGAIFAGIPAFKALPENLLNYSFGQLLGYVKQMFPHLEDAADSISESVYGINSPYLSPDAGFGDGGEDSGGYGSGNKGMADYFTVKQCEPWLYAIKDRMEVFTWLAVGDKEALLFDTGYGIGDLLGEVRKITDKPLTVILSHGHVDHVLGAGQFEQVLLHPADFDVFDEHTGQKWLQKTVDACMKNRDKLHRYMGDFDFVKYLDMAFPKPTALGENAVFDLGGLTAKVVNMPGHTPGSVGLLFLEQKVLLTGDAANRATFLFLPESLSLTEYLDMLGRVAAMDFETHYVGHQDKAYQKKWFDKYIKVAENAIRGKGKPMKIPGFEEYGEIQVSSIGGPIVSPTFCAVGYK